MEGSRPPQSAEVVPAEHSLPKSAELEDIFEVFPALRPEEDQASLPEILLMEAETEGETQRERINAIRAYLVVLSTNNLASYGGIVGSLEKVLYPAGAEIREGYTATVIRDIEAHNECLDEEMVGNLRSSKDNAALFVVRGMIEGLQIPVRDFLEIMEMVAAVIARIRDEDIKVGKKVVMDEIKKIWELEAAPMHGHFAAILADRTAEAFGVWGKPEEYGKKKGIAKAKANQYRVHSVPKTS